MTPDACLESPEAELHKALVGPRQYLLFGPGLAIASIVAWYVGRYNLNIR
jgi:hypothetical protein